MKHRIATLGLLLVACTPQAPSPPSTPAASNARSAMQQNSIAPLARGPVLVADSLTVPWEVLFLPSGDLLVTERSGTLTRIGSERKQYPIAGVRHVGEGGLLGATLHPDFEDNGWVYLYLTTQQGGQVSNRIERYTFASDTLSERTEILSSIPGAANHDGGRIAFGPDGLLYATSGDAQNPELAQRTDSLAGKILRMNDDGSVPADNPFGNLVYSYGHRNPQGLTWDDEDRLWSTEHGRSGVRSGYDELNLIERGNNYGWPEIEGDETGNGITPPVLHSGSSDTWAPASAAFVGGSVFFGGLRGSALYEAVLDGTKATLRTHWKNEYGRIRTVTVGPDGMLYVTTSNTDGRGQERIGDDRVLKVDPDSLEE